MASSTICVSCASLPVKDREAATRVQRCPHCRAQLGVTSYGVCFRVPPARSHLLTAGFTRYVLAGAVLCTLPLLAVALYFEMYDSSLAINDANAAPGHGLVEARLLPHTVRFRDASVPEELKFVREVSLVDFPEGMTPGAARSKQVKLMAQIRQEDGVKQDGFLLAQIERRAELRGLPFIMGDDCKLDAQKSSAFQDSVLHVRTAVDSYGKQPAMFFRQIGADGQSDASVAALAQILGPETAELRTALARTLETSKNPAASKVLARAAIFDPSGDVRIAAVNALKRRPNDEYTDVLMQGMRYPMPIVAKRAAVAIIELKRTDLLPDLADFLAEPPPGDPVVSEVDQLAAHVVSEVVRINHHRNCYLCHAPAGNNQVSEVQGTVPSLGEPFPRTTREYYGSAGELAVRADTTYLRQDFSVMLPVANAAPWPDKQRFDFLVRTRTVAGAELAEFKAKIADRPANYLSENHKAALLALRDLTGQNADANAAAWRRVLGQNR